MTLNEGNTPLIDAPQIAERVGPDIKVYLKFEGANPTVNWLAALYIALRVVYIVCYFGDLQPFRSIVFFAGLIDAIAIFVNPAFH